MKNVFIVLTEKAKCANAGKLFKREIYSYLNACAIRITASIICRLVTEPYVYYNLIARGQTRQLIVHKFQRTRNSYLVRILFESIIFLDLRVNLIIFL